MIIVYLEHSQGNILKSSLVALRAAQEMKLSHGYTKCLGLLIGGERDREVANKAAAFGLDELVFAKAEHLTQYTAVNFAAAFKELLPAYSPRAVVMAATSQGKDLAPRLAYALDAAQASDVVQILAEGRFMRPMYAGNIMAEVELASEKKIITVRTTAFEPAGKVNELCPVTELAIAAAPDNRQKFISFANVKSERPELGDAEVIVSGGRALKSAENFEQQLFPLAEALNAAIGASRAAVDSGYAPNDWQVGQTGKVVAPKLYIAIGISGAIQHLAGMKDSKVIVAINKDPEAAIFEVADYGLVADLFEAVPRLTALLKGA